MKRALRILGSTQVLLGGKVPARSATLRICPKGIGCIRINTRSGWACARVDQPPHRSLRLREVSNAFVFAWIEDAHHAQQVPLHPIRVCRQRAGGVPCDAPCAPLVVHDDFTRPCGCHLGVIQTFQVTMRELVECGLPLVQRHLDARNLFVETQDGQGCLGHHKGQNALSACQCWMSLGKSLRRGEAMVAISQVQRAACLPGFGKRSPLF